MKRKLLAVLMAVCMTTTFVGGSTAVWAALEESTGKDEVIVTMPTTSEPEQDLILHMDGEQENMCMSH